MDRSRAKWRIKLQSAFAGEDSEHNFASFFRRNKPSSITLEGTEEEQRRIRAEGKSGKWALFLLPFITVLREGLEAVIFVAGVRLLAHIRLIRSKGLANH